MPVDAFHSNSSDGKDKDRDGSSSRGAIDGGRSHSRGGGRGSERRGGGLEDDRRQGDKEHDGARRRPESVPAAYGREAAREQSRGHGQPRSSDREWAERHDRGGAHAGAVTDAADHGRARGGARQQHFSREREREREPERPDYPSRDREKQQQQQQRGGDLREQLNQMRNKDHSYRDRSPVSRDDQGNGSNSRTPPAGSARPAGSAASNPFCEELRRVGQSLLEGRRTPETQPSPAVPAVVGAGRVGAAGSRLGPPDARSSSDDEEGMEAGEIPGTDADEPEGRKRRQPPSPSERPGPSAKSARVAMAPGNQGILSRVIDDVESFKALQAELDFDPDAPALVKSSPSGSEELSENEFDAKYRQQREAAKSGRGQDGGDSGNEEEDGGGEAAGVKSRWMVDADAGADAKGQDDGGSDRDGAGGGGGAVSGSDSDDESLPPSPRSLLNKTYNMLQDCRGVEEFEKVGRISEGTYGVVYKAREKTTGRLVALKMIKMEREKEGFPVTSIREINVLLNFHHPNIVHVSEIVVNHTKQDQVFMVMELMDHDLKSILEPGKAKEIRMSRPFSVSDVKNLMLQFLRGVSYLHNNWVLHRDLKTSNILYNSKGELKICDFGLARQYGSPLKPYTHNVVTLWYRAPELLFGSKIYSTAVDMWSVGCIMGELLLGAALMPGQGEFEQIDKIVQLLGTPTPDVWPGLKELPGYSKVVLKQVPSQLRSKFQTSYGGGAMVTEAGFDLLSQLLAWDPAQRMSADAAMEHRWFKETPLPQKQELMPTFAPR